jgi:DNA processing protein
MIIKHKLDGVTGERLRHLHDAPTQLFYRGTEPNDLLQRPAVAIVGSRKMTPYGRAVTERLATELARAGVTIISGLALGVDSAAHRACVEAGGGTIAVLPSSPNNIYPSSHQGLARDILSRGGTLLSEYGEMTPALQHTFIARNRIIAALADAVLIPEAALKSGSLHTAAFALDLGIPVMAVPGPINSPMSEGTNQLIRTGALVVTDVNDVLSLLGIEAAGSKNAPAATAEERLILEGMQAGISDGGSLLDRSGLPGNLFSQTLTLLELQGRIRSLGADQWSLV